MSASVAYPVQVLREHITGLEAAISVCLADPDHKPVHRLRTETRRVEALLVLLGLIPGLPDHRKEAATLLRALAKLRRAAGSVRDLDVHRKMLESFAEAEQPASEARPASGASAANPPNGSANTAKRKANTPEATPADSAPDSNAALLNASAVELRKSLGRDRDKAAAALQAVLEARQARTARAAEALLTTLKPVEGLALPGEDLLRDAEAVLKRDRLLTKGQISGLDEDELHTIRKAAKKARYLAESLPDDAALVAAANRFEALQEAGGQWHDALELARAARHHFGKGHELTAAYRAERDTKLEAYRRALAAEVKAPEKPDGRSRPAAPRKLAKARKVTVSPKRVPAAV